MGRKIKEVVLSAALFLSSLVAYSQEEQSVNYIPSKMEQLINYSDGKLSSDLESKEKRSLLANSVFFYEGYQLPPWNSISGQGFFERYFLNLDSEFKKIDFLRFSGQDLNWEDLDNFPFEREAYSALGKTLVEKYKFARRIDKTIRRARDASTVSFEYPAGIKSRFGFFIGETDINELGFFWKLRWKDLHSGFIFCQKEIDSYLELERSANILRGGYKYETGLGDNPIDRSIYLSFRKQFL
jgi:hypothetical protein